MTTRSLPLGLLLIFAGCNTQPPPATGTIDKPLADISEDETVELSIQPKLVEVTRFSTPTHRAAELILTSKGEVLVVRGLSELEAWDLSSHRMLWSANAENYDHHLLPSDKELVWLDQSRLPPAICHSDLLTGKDISRQPLEFGGRRLFNAVFAWEDKPILAAQAEFADGDHVLLFSVDSGRLLSEFDIPDDVDGVQVNIQGLGLAAQGERVLVTARSGLVLCDTLGNVLHRYAIEDAISHFPALPQKEWALGCDNVFGSPLCFFNLKSGKLVERDEHQWEAVGLDVSADGKWAVTGGRSRFEADRNYYSRTNKSEGGEVILWDVATQKPVFKINPCVNSVGAVAISADGRWVAAAENGDTEGQIVVFERKDGSP